MHILVSAIALNWFYYYGLLYWLVAYRYLDVGPRRALQTLYNTPTKLAARPWAPKLNWAVITTITCSRAGRLSSKSDLCRAARRCATRTHRVAARGHSRRGVQRRRRDAELGHDSEVHWTGPGADLIPVVAGD